MCKQATVGPQTPDLRTQTLLACALGRAGVLGHLGPARWEHAHRDVQAVVLGQGSQHLRA